MHKLKWLFMAALVIFSLIVIFQNLAPTEVRLLFSSFELSKAALLLIMLGVGYLLGLSTPTLWRFAAKRAKNRKSRESQAANPSNSP